MAEQRARFELRSISPLATGKVLSVIQTCLGLVSGLTVSAYWMFHGILSVEAPSFSNFNTNLYGLLLMSPLLGAVSGFVTGVVFGVVYNWMSERVGGVEIVLTRESEA